MYGTYIILEWCMIYDNLVSISDEGKISDTSIEKLKSHFKEKEKEEAEKDKELEKFKEKDKQSKEEINQLREKIEQQKNREEKRKKIKQNILCCGITILLIGLFIVLSIWVHKKYPQILPLIPVLLSYLPCVTRFRQYLSRIFSSSTHSKPNEKK